jgi:hypothetical protein
VTVGLHAGRRSFLVFSNSATENQIAPSTEKDAILNTLLYKNNKKDSQGRLILARTRIEER